MHGILALFAETEIFIYVFIEIMARLKSIQKVMLEKGNWRDKLIFIAVFGAFSIFGTYVGIPLPDGAIINIRDFAPMMAGLTAGPLMGLAVGLVGGLHRLLLGGFTCVSCGLATVIAGLLSGAVYYFNKGKLIGIFPGLVLAIVVEIIHGAITLLIARPLTEAVEVIKVAIPGMMVANGLGVVVAIIILEHTKELKQLSSQVREVAGHKG
jgi:sigma-B regulation protein RsbU (phosphoserine phosphatase)